MRQFILDTLGAIWGLIVVLGTAFIFMWLFGYHYAFFALLLAFVLVYLWENRHHG